MAPMKQEAKQNEAKEEANRSKALLDGPTREKGAKCVEWASRKKTHAEAMELSNRTHAKEISDPKKRRDLG